MNINEEMKASEYILMGNMRKQRSVSNIQFHHSLLVHVPCELIK